MNYSRLFYLFVLFLFLQSCGGVENPFSNKKNNNNDEFLVEKKSPLVMPPDYDNLPKPDSEDNQTKKNNNIKELVSKNQKNTQENINSGSLEGSILEKIKFD